MVESMASLVKKVDGVGRKAGDIPRKVLMKFEDRKSGKAKCAAIVEVADTRGLRERGLSKRASLGKMSGMLFNCRGPFWMKDVEFPLDLCYLDEGGRVTEKVAMAKDKSGSTLYPAERPESVSAVELPSGFCRKWGVSIGDRLVPVAAI